MTLKIDLLNFSTLNESSKRESFNVTIATLTIQKISQFIKSKEDAAVTRFIIGLEDRKFIELYYLKKLAF